MGVLQGVNNFLQLSFTSFVYTQRRIDYLFGRRDVKSLDGVSHMSIASGRLADAQWIAQRHSPSHNLFYHTQPECRLNKLIEYNA
jgi:hypothetical protein